MEVLPFGRENQLPLLYLKQVVYRWQGNIAHPVAENFLSCPARVLSMGLPQYEMRWNFNELVEYLPNTPQGGTEKSDRLSGVRH